jgi:hypothetical protein
VNVIQKPLSGLKNAFQNTHEAFQGFGSGFTELHAKLDADTLVDFAIHHRQNKARNRKSNRVNQCLFTAQCHVVD